MVKHDQTIFPRAYPVQYMAIFYVRIGDIHKPTGPSTTPVKKIDPKRYVKSHGHYAQQAQNVSNSKEMLSMDKLLDILLMNLWGNFSGIPP